MKERIVIAESEWDSSVYRTREWENTVEIIRWEHDYENKQYVIEFKYLSK